MHMVAWTHAQATFNMVYPEARFSTNTVAVGEDLVTAAQYVSRQGQNGIRWMRIDSAGTLVQQDSVLLSSGEGLVTGASLVAKPNGNLIIIGWGYLEAFMLEVNAQFDSVRSVRYNHAAGFKSLFYEATLCVNGDIAVAGELDFYPMGDSVLQRAALVVRFDSNFVKLWDDYVEKPRTGVRFEDIEQVAGSLIEMADSSLIVRMVRYSDYYIDSSTNFLLRYDNEGNLIWNKRVGDAVHEDGGLQLLSSTDTTFYVAQFKGFGRFTFGALNYEKQKEILAEYNLYGTLLFEKVYPGFRVRGGVVGILRNDNRLYILRGDLDSVTFRYNAGIRCVNLQGDSIWHIPKIAFPKSQYYVSILHDIAVTPSGALLLSGRGEYGVGLTDYFETWAIRTDAEGCFSPGCHNISLDEVKTSLEPVYLYPNPANSYFNIHLNQSVFSDRIEVFVLDMSGTVVRNLTTRERVPTISTQGLSKGVYLVEIQIGATERIRRKLVISN